MGDNDVLPDDYEVTQEDLAELEKHLDADAVEPDNQEDQGGSKDPADAGDEDKAGAPPADDADKGDEAPEGAGDEGGDDDSKDPPEGDAGDAGDDADKGQEELGGLSLADLKELGIGEFESVEDAKKSLRNLRSFVGQKDQDARLGRQLRRRGVDPARLDALLHQDPGKGREKEPAKGGRPEYDPAWEDMVEPERDEEGNVVGYKGPQEVVDKLKAFHTYQTNLWNRIYRGDQEAVAEMFGPVIDSRAEQLLKDRQAKASMDAFIKKNGDFLLDHEEEFYDLMDNGASPELAVEVLQGRHGKPAGADKGKESEKPDDQADPKTADVEDLKKKATKPARTPAPPAGKTKMPDLDNMDEEDIARLAVERAGIQIDDL